MCKQALPSVRWKKDEKFIENKIDTRTYEIHIPHLRQKN